MSMIIDASSRLSHDTCNQREVVEPRVLESLELWYFNRLVQAVDTNLVPVVGKEKYMLIELANENNLKLISTIFYDLQLRGYIPIIALGEENTYLKANPNIILNLVGKGALVQVNVSSILGDSGKAIQKFILKLCKRKLVHFIASDTQHAINKLFLLNKAYKYLEKKVSIDYVKFLKENEKHFLKGTDFHVPDLENRKVK